MWENDPIVLQLIEYMISRGCKGMIQPPTNYTGINLGYIEFEFEGVIERIDGIDIGNALHAAYRVEYTQSGIRKRFERYLIDLNNKRQKSK